MQMVESPIRPLNQLDSDVVEFPRDDGSRIPYKVFSSQAVYEREQQHDLPRPDMEFRRAGSRNSRSR